MPLARACLVTLFALPIPLAAQAVQLVGPGGFATIQAAIDAAAPGDTVLVDAGVYPSFAVGKPLTITAMPSALVQVVTTGNVAITLQPFDRVHLAGLDVQANAITFTGGLVSAERCTMRTTRTLMVTDGIALLRWSSAGSLQGNGITVRNGHLHASDSTFSTAASGVSTIEYGGIKLLGSAQCLLASCTLIGSWPVSVDAPWPSVALHASRADATSRAWLTDCNLLGGFHLTGPLGPSLVAASNGAARVRLHRTQTSGLAIGNVATGPVIGVGTPVDMTIGSTFVTTLHSEPGHPVLFYVGLDIAGPVQIPEVEQPAFGFLATTIFPSINADAQGQATFAFQVPNNPALRHTALFWRGLDLVALPWLATPVFVTVVQ